MAKRTIPIKVFLADDSDLIRVRTAELLSSRAIDVVGEGSTPHACIDGVLATRPDVVVLDIQLKDGSGLEVLRAVRQARPELAFIVFSIHTDPIYRNLYLSHGVQRFLEKGTEFDQLVGAVEAAYEAHP
jgi:DNA-binding NarL/FixJ family response regulator